MNKKGNGKNLGMNQNSANHYSAKIYKFLDHPPRALQGWRPRLLSLSIRSSVYRRRSILTCEVSRLPWCVKHDCEEHD